jgi:hypothetical protein
MRWLLGIILTLTTPLLLAQLPPSTPKPKAASERPQQNAKAKTNATSTPPAQAAANTAIENSGGQTVGNQAQAVRVESVPPVAVSRDWFDITTLGLTLLLVFVGIVGTSIAVKTLKALQKEVVHANIIAGAATDNAVAARDNAIAAKTTADLMADTAQRELRAYICLANALLKFYGPNLFEGQVTMKNCGKTPAYKVDPRILTWIGECPLPSEFELPWPANIGAAEETAVLGPDQEHILIRLRDPVAEIGSPLGRPNATVYVYGVVMYEDAFGKKQSTKFCLTWGGRMTRRNGEDWGVLQSYSEGNDAT